MATITSKGQVTLPKEIRDALGLVPGSEVEFELGDKGAIIRKKVSPRLFERWSGHLRGKLPAASVDEMMERLRGERHLPAVDQQ